MVDAVNLIFRDDSLQLFIELARGLQVVSEGFFHDYAGPMAVLLLGEAGLTELLHDGREKARGDGQVEKPVPSGVVLLVDCADLLREALERFSILEIALDVIDALGEPRPDCGVDQGGGIFGNFFRQSLAEAFRGVVVAGETDDGELLR